MTATTPASLRSLVLYEVYVRNHGPNGTFADVEADLPRIRDLGVDVVWLMPIHPIGVTAKKGSLGCPYSIRDYREVNPSNRGRPVIVAPAPGRSVNPPAVHPLAAGSPGPPSRHRTAPG